MSTSFPPSIPSQDEREKINDLEKKIITEAEHSKKVYERKIKIRGLETEMKKKQAEQDEKIKTLEKTVTIQSQVIEKLEEKSKSQDRKIAELEEKFQSLSQYIYPAVSILSSQLEDLSVLVVENNQSISI